ncbi:hypothetical protein C0989_007416, partial [Termitomyces sp. Mn162]
MVPSLCQKYLIAIEMSEAAVHHFAEQSMGISAKLISSWEAEITIAESLRDQDKKAMDILKAWTIGLQARHGGNLADTRLEAGGWMPDTDTFWIQLALDIEEWQTTPLKVDEIPGAFDEEMSEDNETLPDPAANLLAGPDPLLELDSAAPEDFEISLPSTIA